MMTRVYRFTSCVISVLALSASSSLTACTAPKPIQKPSVVAPLKTVVVEKPEFYFDDRNWKIGYKAAQNGISIREYVLDGESVETWTELVTQQFFLGLQRKFTLEDFMEGMKSNLGQKAEGLKWSVVNKSDRTITYEWQIEDDRRNHHEYEAGHLILGDRGIHLIRYSIRNVVDAAVRRHRWTDRLNTIRLKPTSFSLGPEEFISRASDGDTIAVELFLADGMSPDARGAQGRTALMIAAFAAHSDTLMVLLEHGADLNARDQKGMTSLILATMADQRETVKLLLEHGADVNVRDIEGNTALDWATLLRRTKVMDLLVRPDSAR